MRTVINLATGKVVEDHDYVPEPSQPAPEPSTDPRDRPLNRFQFEAFILGMDLDMQALETAIRQLGLSKQEQGVALSRLRNAVYYNRSHPLVEAVRGRLNMSVEQLDAAWLAAAALK